METRTRLIHPSRRTGLTQAVAQALKAGHAVELSRAASGLVRLQRISSRDDRRGY